MMFEPLSILAFIAPSGLEFIVVMLVLLVMFGAKDAPRIFRKINEMINSVRNTADGFKREIMYGDLSSDTSAADEGYEEEYYDGVDDLDDEYGYAEEEAERDYSDETFQNLEKDLERAEEDDAGEPAADEEVDDAPKA